MLFRYVEHCGTASAAGIRYHQLHQFPESVPFNYTDSWNQFRLISPYPKIPGIGYRFFDETKTAEFLKRKEKKNSECSFSHVEKKVTLERLFAGSTIRYVFFIVLFNNKAFSIRSLYVLKESSVFSTVTSFSRGVVINLHVVIRDANDFSVSIHLLNSFSSNFVKRTLSDHLKVTVNIASYHLILSTHLRLYAGMKNNLNFFSFFLSKNQNNIT